MKLFRRILTRIYFSLPFGNIIAKILVAKVQKRLNNVNGTLESYLKFIYHMDFLPFLHGGLLDALTIRPVQIKSEIQELLGILLINRPAYLMEIGTAYGGTLFLFAQVAKSDAKIISVDLPRGYPEWKIPLYLSFARANQRIYLLREDSHDPRTLNKVKSTLGDKKLDFLFIDGDHSYQGVKKDFEMYAPLVRKGGIIAFHDIVPDYFTRYGIRTGAFTGGVPRFWQEIKQNYKHQEIVQDYNQDAYGVGVIYWECERS